MFAEHVKRLKTLKILSERDKREAEKERADKNVKVKTVWLSQIIQRYSSYTVIKNIQIISHRGPEKLRFMPSVWIWINFPIKPYIEDLTRVVISNEI